MIRSVSRLLAAALSLWLVASAAAQVQPGQSPLSGSKGGTNNAFMQFTGPASPIKTYTLPNATDTIATLSAVQTMSGKTLTSAILNTPTINNATMVAPIIGAATGTSLALTTTGTEGSQLTAQSTSASTGRGGVVIQNANGGGGFVQQQDSAGAALIQNNGTANTINWYDRAGNNVMRMVGGAALSNTQFNVLSTNGATSTSTGSITTPGGISTAGNIYGGAALRVGSAPGSSYGWINTGADATAGRAFAFAKNRDATVNKAWAFFDVGGLTTDAAGGAFWRGVHLIGPTFTDPTGGANRFPTASMFYEFNSLSAPSTRNFVLDVANTSATAASAIVFRQEGVEKLRIHGSGISATGDVAMSGGIFVPNDINMTRTGGGGTSAFLTVDNVTTTSINIAKVGGGNINAFNVFANAIALNGAVTANSLNVSGLTASRLVATDGADNLVSTITSANVAASISDETGTGAAVFATSPVLVTPNLGTPSAGVLTNATGLPVATGISGLGAGIAAFLATPSSANLRAAMTDETGTGLNYFQGGDLGTPSAGVLTNATGLPTAGLVNNAVTNAKLATMSTGTFKGNVSGSTASPSDLSATQVTAALNGCVGDSGSGGTKGMVPAPGAGDAAAGKFLKADCTWAVPAGGGGGGMTDAERQNATLSLIYQSKLYGGYRRVINQIADGYKASDGVAVGSSTNYSIDTTNGRVAPSSSATQISQAAGTNIGDLIGGGGLAAGFDGTTSQSYSSSATSPGAPSNGYIGKNYSSAPKKIIKVDYWPSNDFGFDGSGSASTITVILRGKNGSAPASRSDGTSLGSDSFSETTSGPKTINSTDVATSYDYVWIDIATSATAGMAVAEARFFEPTVNNMTVVTTAQTVTSSVGNGRVLLEYNPVDSITLNTDLTAEVTCNGGTNWSSATLSTPTNGIGQAGRSIAETADTACTSGTSFAARLKTLNSKNVQIYGTSISVH